MIVAAGNWAFWLLHQHLRTQLEGPFDRRRASSRCCDHGLDSPIPQQDTRHVPKTTVSATSGLGDSRSESSSVLFVAELSADIYVSQPLCVTGWATFGRWVICWGTPVFDGCGSSDDCATQTDSDVAKSGMRLSSRSITRDFGKHHTYLCGEWFGALQLTLGAVVVLRGNREGRRSGRSRRRCR